MTLSASVSALDDRYKAVIYDGGGDAAAVADVAARPFALYRELVAVHGGRLLWFLFAVFSALVHRFVLPALLCSGLIFLYDDGNEIPGTSSLSFSPSLCQSDQNE